MFNNKNQNVQGMNLAVYVINTASRSFVLYYPDSDLVHTVWRNSNVW